MQDHFHFIINIHDTTKKPFSRTERLFLAVRTGLEPATPCVTGMYSNQAELPHLDKLRRNFLAVRTGLEPATPCVTGMYSNQAELPHQICVSKLRSLFASAKVQQNSKPANDSDVFFQFFLKKYYILKVFSIKMPVLQYSYLSVVR